jgi:hypothetical protein
MSTVMHIGGGQNQEGGFVEKNGRMAKERSQHDFFAFSRQSTSAICDST